MALVDSRLSKWSHIPLIRISYGVESSKDSAHLMASTNPEASTRPPHQKPVVSLAALGEVDMSAAFEERHECSATERFDTRMRSEITTDLSISMGPAPSF